jgi:membrane fusion protein, copper/silver efflux system
MIPNEERVWRAAISPSRVVTYSLLIATTVGGVYWATHGTASPTAMTAEHSHGAAASAPNASPVMLTPQQAQRIGVTYAVATVGPLEREVRTVGQIVYDETRLRAISPKIDGYVERLLVNATGQPVVMGQPLLTIYSPMLVQAQEELLLAKRLTSDVSAASDDVRHGAANLLESSRRRLAYWDIPVGEISAIEERGTVQRTLTLRSPATGYVLQKNVVAGQRIMAGDALYQVADLRTVWVEGEVFEQDLAQVRGGQMVHADFEALPGVHRMGRIAYVYPVISPDTRTARVRVVLSNEDVQLKPGMYATLRIVGADRTPALTIPRDAVLSTGERHVVFVREATGQLAPREVALGSSNDTRVEVLRGIAAGDTVVASATFLVDAESNLGKALGGMGNMPGMDMSAPPTPLPMKSPSATGTSPSRPTSKRNPRADTTGKQPSPPVPPASAHDGHTRP